ncbi:MAG: glycosyltransferase [Promethearchaeota archaeon]
MKKIYFDHHITHPRDRNISNFFVLSNFKNADTILISSPIEDIKFKTILRLFSRRNIIINFHFSTYFRKLAELNKKDPIYLLFEKNFLIIASKIVTDTYTFTKVYSAFFKIPKEKFIVLHGMVDTDKFKPIKVPKEYDLVYHGSFCKSHGVELLIHALKLINKKLKILLIGSANQAKSIKEKIVELNLIHYFKFMDHVSYEKLPYFLNHAKLGIGNLAGLYKSHCVLRSGLIELLSCGIPTITAKTLENITNIPSEYVEYIDPDNAVELANKILHLLEKYEKEKIKNYNSRKIITEKFSLKEFNKRKHIFRIKNEIKYSLTRIIKILILRILISIKKTSNHLLSKLFRKKKQII